MWSFDRNHDPVFSPRVFACATLYSGKDEAFFFWNAFFTCGLSVVMSSWGGTELRICWGYNEINQPSRWNRLAGLRCCEHVGFEPGGGSVGKAAVRSSGMPALPNTIPHVLCTSLGGQWHGTFRRTQPMSFRSRSAGARMIGDSFSARQ